MRHLLFTIFLFIVYLLTAQSVAEIKIEIDNQQLSLTEAMKVTNSPGFSYYLDRGEQREGIQLGLTEAGGEQRVNEHTVYQVGSPSSALLAFTALQLATEGMIDLEKPVNEYLKRWKIPGRKARSFTVKDLLLSKGRFGTAYKPEGYLRQDKLPTLLEIISGNGPAKNKAFTFKGVRKPNTNLEYGGWLVLQLLLEDQLGKPLAEIIQERVFVPLEMNDSFYATELTEDEWGNAAAGHDEQGKKLANSYFRYPELANHGLWSTPKDYGRFVRYVLDAAKGKENRLISQELAKQSTTRQYGQRSLIFHIDDYQNPFWGGATKGYYFYVQANAKENYVVVSASNRQLNWQLCNKSCWAAYPLVKEANRPNRLGVFYQEDDQPQLDNLLPELRKTCANLDIRIELIPAIQGVPAEITATPAFVFQNEKGRSIHAGKHLDLEAITLFLKTNLYAPRANKTDERENINVGRFGRQQIAVPLKVTAIEGAANALVGELDFAAQLQHCYVEVSNQTYQVRDNTSLQPTDRRFYLDVHPYVLANGELLLSYAIFSQFNCHEQLADNFGDPIRVAPGELNEGMCVLAEKSLAQIQAFRQNKAGGENPNPLNDQVENTSWQALGWQLSTPPQLDGNEAIAPVYLPNSLSKIRPLQTGLPLIQFNFPPPIDRYAGSVNNVTGNLAFSAEQTLLSGQFTVDVNSLTMGNGSLDKYVLGDALNVKKYPTATLAFTDFELPIDAMNTPDRQLTIPANFTLKGKVVPVTILANFTPQLDAAGQPELKSVTEFGINIKELFGLKGPDGPEDVKDLVVVRGVFLLG